MKMSRVEKLFVNSSFQSRSVARRAVERLRPLAVRRRQRYLDVGCGNGAAAIQVAQQLALDVTGVDVDPEQVREARDASRHLENVAFRLGDAACLPFPDAAFDVVATSKTTHHLSRWQEALAEMTRVTRPGGYLLNADLVVPPRLSRWLRRVGNGPVGVFTRTDLDRCFDALGLDPVRVVISQCAYEAVFRKVTCGARERDPMAPTRHE